MPSLLHETLIEMFRHRPSLAAEVLSGPFKLDLPDWQQIRVESGELTELTPAEYRADAVVLFTARDTPVLAVIIEVQLRRDRHKRYSWPHYLTSLHARLRCRAVLLVICPDRSTAGWCATPIDIGHPDWLLRPLVLGPSLVPVVTDHDHARRAPELAVLSALTHGSGPEQDQIFRAMLGGLEELDEDHANLYADIVLAWLPKAARNCLETLMNVATYEYQSDFARRYFFQGKAEGRAEGEAQGVLAVLAARGVEVPEDARQRITECADLDQLETWLRRAATADSINDLFAPRTT